jgi:hypothetical protein
VRPQGPSRAKAESENQFENQRRENNMSINSGNSIFPGSGSPVDTGANANQEQRGANLGFMPSPSPQAGRSAYESNRTPIDIAELGIDAPARDGGRR